MKLPYGYVLIDEEIIVHEEKVDVVHSIFEHYLAGASLGKIVDMLFAKGSPQHGIQNGPGRLWISSSLIRNMFQSLV